jgi:hypothetical protein
MGKHDEGRKRRKLLKIEILEHPKSGNIFGVELIAENDSDREIIKRFDEGGIKKIGVTTFTRNCNLPLPIKLMAHICNKKLGAD